MLKSINWGQTICLFYRGCPLFRVSIIRTVYYLNSSAFLLLHTDSHQWLLGEDIDILSSLLLPLAGPEQFSEEEMEQLPEDLQYLPDNKTREEDPDIRKMLIEALMKVCTIFVVI